MHLLSSVVDGDLQRGLVDPDLVGQSGERGSSADEALGVCGEGGVEYLGTARERRGGDAVVDVVRGAERERAVTMLAVVPVEETIAVRTCIFDAAEAVGEAGPVLERLESRLGEGVVVGDVRAR